MLTELTFAGEVIANQRQLKSKEHQEANIITEKSILKSRETNRIRGLWRVIWEIPEKPIAIELRKKQEIETEWEFLGESKKLNSADQIGQLNDLRFKTKMGHKNLSGGKSVQFRKNEMPGMEWGIPKEETYRKYGDAAREVEIGAVGKMGHFANSFCGCTGEGGRLLN